MSGDSTSALGQTVREHYGLDVRRVVAVRSVYRVFTADGVYCLKRLGAKSQRNLAFVADMTAHLWRHGFPRVPRYLLTTSGAPTCTLDGTEWVLTTWQDARETDLDKPRHLRAAAEGLAELHAASAGFPIQPRHRPFNRLGTWFVEIRRGLDELTSWRDVAGRRTVPSDLDRLVLREYDLLRQRCLEALVQLSCTDYRRLLSEAPAKGLYCHNSLYYQNILLDRRGAAHFVDLDKSVLDLRARDVAMLVSRRLKQVDWRMDEALFILDSYQRVAPLSRDDLSAVYCRLLYPERLLKRLRAHYGHKEKPLPEVLRRVMSLIKNEDRLNQFLVDFPGRVKRVYGAALRS